jgi:hypothetical protein
MEFRIAARFLVAYIDYHDQTHALAVPSPGERPNRSEGGQPLWR